MFSQLFSDELTSDGAGDGTLLLGPVKGRIINVIYEADPTTPYDATVDFTVTTENTKQTIWGPLNVPASRTRAPRQETHKTGGGVTGGYDFIHCAGVNGEKVKIVIAQAGATKKGKFTIIADDD